MSNLDRSKLIVKEMLYQRYYVINKEGEEDGDYIIYVTKKNGEKMCVFFTNIDKFNTEFVQFYTKKINSLGIKHCMIIYKSSITSSANKMLMNIPVIKKTIKSKTKLENILFEMFKYNEVMFNITKHELQPKRFTEFSVKESQLFKKTYGNKFPKLSTTDPIVKFFNFKQGSVIEIERKNGYITHRIVKKKA